MNSKNLKLLMLGVFVLVSSNVACMKKRSVISEGTAKQILYKGNGTEPADIDPHIVTGVPEHGIIGALFEGLVEEDPKDLRPVPGVAESWKVSPDQTVYTFKLRPSASWSNGEPVTAHDFVYSWKRILSPKLGAEYAYMLYYVKNAEAYNKRRIGDFNLVGVKATDDHTLEVTLEAPTSFFLSLLQHYSTFPVHKGTIEKFGKMDERGTKWTRAGNFVGNGAFTLKQWDTNKVLVVEKNPKYWDADKVRLNQVHFMPIESDQVEERSFRAGELHVTNTIPLNKIETYKGENPDLIKIHPYFTTYFYRINTTKPPLNDERVRKALAMSIDRKAIVENVTKAGQLPAFAFTPPGTAGYTAKAALTYDVAKAKKLMAEAGFPEGQGFPGFEILYNTAEGHKKIAEAIQQMWKANLGIHVTLTNQEWKVYLETEKKLDYQVSRAAWVGDYPDPNTFLDLFLTGGGNNKTGWSSEKYDKLIQQAAKTASHRARLELFQLAEAVLLDEVPIIPIYIYTRTFLIRPEVKGWFPNVMDHHPLKHVYLEAGDGKSELAKQ